MVTDFMRFQTTDALTPLWTQLRVPLSIEDGEKKNLTGMDLQRLVRKAISEVGISGEEWVLQMPEQIKIEGTSSELPPLRVENFIRERIKTFCADCRLSSFRIGASRLSSIAAEEELSFSLSSANIGPQLLLQINGTGSQRAQQFASVQLKIEKEVGVLNRALLSGSRVKRQDLQTNWVEIKSTMEMPLSIPQIEGRELRQNVAAFSTITPTMLKKEYTINRGQIVKALMDVGDLEISQSVTAEESGELGSLIRVRSVEAKKQLSGRVVDAGVVRIQ